MTDLLLGVALVLAVVAAARSTYSPCGLSMLSSITPFGEAARGHRYRGTATWFLIGAVVGGATLGLSASLLALGVSAVGLPSHRWLVADLGGAAALLAGAVDAGVFGEIIPVIRRQVDDRWLARYRPWFYGAGFGWQVGVGVATYVMTAAVFVLVLLSALTGSVGDALIICSAFGLARGLTVFLTRLAPDPGRLRALHARLDRLAGSVKACLIGLETLAGGILIGQVSLLAGLLVTIAVTFTLFAGTRLVARRTV